jgi:peptidoglycan/LPS O-acetylase OafA/YrhL
METKNKNRFAYLDVLRGGAALAVCIQHMFGYIYSTADKLHPLYSMTRFIVVDSVNWGLFGVILFFLVSGFIIPNSLKKGTQLRHFFISRVFRLYPAYWLVLVLIFSTASYLGHTQPHYSYGQLMANVTMMPKLFGASEMSGIFWTLFVEIVFYVCCVVLFKFNWLNKSLNIGLIVIGLNLLTPISIVLNKFFQFNIPIQFIFFHLSFLFAGNLLRLAYVEGIQLAKYFSQIFIFLLMITVPISTGLLFDVPEASKKGFIVFNAWSVVNAYILAIVTFIYAIHFKNFNNKFMLELGEISYSLYLFHMLCFMVVMKFIPPDNWLNSIFFMIISASLAYFVAKIVFKYIENPSILVGKNMIKTYA